MRFGLNRAEVIGRLGADVTVNHLVSGVRVANLKEGPAGLRRGQAADAALAQGRRGRRSLLDRDPPGPRFPHPVPGSAGRPQRQRRARRGRGGGQRFGRAGGWRSHRSGRFDTVLTASPVPSRKGPALRAFGPFLMLPTSSPGPRFTDRPRELE